VNDAGRLAISNTAQSTANQARTDVETARSNLITQLNATGDSSAAASGAIRQAQTLNQPQAMSSLGQVFSDFSSGLSAVGSNSRNGYSGIYSQYATTPSVSGSSGSSRVVG